MLFICATLLLFSAFKEHAEFDIYWHSPIDWFFSAGSRFIAAVYLFVLFFK